MNRLILCEGKTDAILLSYYLEKTAGWKTTSALKTLDIKARQDNESAYWYKKGNEMLLICGVGGKDNFANFFNRDIKKAMLSAGACSRVAIVTDRDDRSIADIERSISNNLSPFFHSIQNRKWLVNEYVDLFNMPQQLESLLLVIPTDQQGALETVMLSAISEDPYDKRIVDQCEDFVENIRPNAAKYISTDRLQLKAHLSTVWAIQSPEKAFDFIDRQIKTVSWEKYTTLHACFGILETI